MINPIDSIICEFNLYGFFNTSLNIKITPLELA